MSKKYTKEYDATGERASGTVSPQLILISCLNRNVDVI